MCEGYNSVQSGTETDKNYLAEAKFNQFSNVKYITTKATLTAIISKQLNHHSPNLMNDILRSWKTQWPGDRYWQLSYLFCFDNWSERKSLKVCNSFELFRTVWISLKFLFPFDFIALFAVEKTQTRQAFCLDYFKKCTVAVVTFYSLLSFHMSLGLIIIFLQKCLKLGRMCAALGTVCTFLIH